MSSQTDFVGGHPESSIQTVKDALRTTPHEIPPFLWGPPGIGKTDLVQQVAQEDDARVTVLKASELRPEDLAGVPMPYEEGWTQFHPLKQLLELTQEWPDMHRSQFEERKQRKINEKEEQLRRQMNQELEAMANQKDVTAEQVRNRREEMEANIEEQLDELGQTLEDEYEEPYDGPVYLFLDEFSNAQPDMVAPFQYLVLNREVGGVGGYELRDNVRIIAAGNREEDRAMAHELTTPLKSRFMHFEVWPELDEWVAWARENEVHPNVIAFLKQREKFLFDFEPDQIDKTFPCPRNWAMVSEVLHKLDDMGLTGSERARKVRKTQVAGLVGPGAAHEYMAFEEIALNAPTAEEIINDPKTIAERIDEDDNPDLAMVSIENLISAVRRNPDKFVDGGLKFAAQMHTEFQTIFHTAIMNLHGDMPEEAIKRVFESEEWETVRQNIERMDSVLREGEEFEQDGGGGRGI